MIVAIVGIAAALAAVVLGTNSTATNSTSINTTLTNITCPPGLYVAINANLAINEKWISRIPNTTSSNITLTQMINTTEYLVREGKCNEALLYLTHIRKILVQEVVQYRKAEIINATLSFRLRLINKSLAMLGYGNLTELNTTLDRLSLALKSGNYTEANQLLQKVKLMVINITRTVEANESLKAARKIDKELDHYVMLIIKESVNLNQTLTRLDYLERIMNYTSNYVKLNVTKIQVIKEIKGILRELKEKLHASKAEEKELLNKLKSDEDISQVMSDLDNYVRGHSNGGHGNDFNKGTKGGGNRGKGRG